MVGIFLGAADCLAQDPSAADSLVLERTLCLGTCPAYRLRLASDGGVYFESRNPGDSTVATVATDRRPPETLDELVRAAADAGFFALPATIRGNEDLCSLIRSDHPTVTITIFTLEGPSSVEWYTGCVALADTGDSGGGSGGAVHRKLVRLYEFAGTIDSVLASERWVRPARRR